MNPGHATRQGTRLNGHAGGRHAVTFDVTSRRASSGTTSQDGFELVTSGGQGEGVLYFNVGLRCLARLCVSVHSLRKVYGGPVTLMTQGELPQWAREVMAALGVQVLDIPQEDASSRTMKASLWRHSPYEVTLFLDSDTLVLQDPSPLFADIRKHGFVVTQFSNWVTSGSRMRKRILAWRPLLSADGLDKALHFGPAVNTGVVGWRRNASILKPWEAHSRRGWQANCTRRLIDELACQVLLHQHPHHVVPDRWNHSVRFGVDSDPAIIHYHGNKHTGNRPACERWKDEYWDFRNQSSAYDALGQDEHDDSLRDYLKTIVRNDVTIVTVVNRAYLHKLKANWPRWMATRGLREQRYMVFSVDGADLGFLRPYRNVQVIPWNHMGNDRRGCLSTFVFGVARHVTTPYWMKLDCDTHPKADTFTWPDYRGHAITAHRWGYTRVKGDPSARQHWLNTLDQWWGGEPLFPANIPIGRHGHPRISSYCAIEKTDFTKRLAARCGNALPVPSQDTTAWYAAIRWGESIHRVNMKRQMQPG